MNKEIIKKWEANKKYLEAHFANKSDLYGSWECEYKDVVKAVVQVIINDDVSTFYTFDTERMTVVDDGDYQGSQLFIFPRETYQPSPNDYLVTYEYYGSCSGCDTLMSIQEDSKEELVTGLMDMSLHLIQNMKFIYGEEE